MMRQLYMLCLTLVICIHTARACLPVKLAGDGRSTPTRDTIQPTITCPSNIHKIADPATQSASVSWNEDSIVVNDNSNDEIRKTRTGLSSGSMFGEGVTTIMYHARDNSGNYASCSFNITVEVIRCSQWDALIDGWKLCNVGYEMRFGTVCEFGCYTGHVLIGAKMRECQMSGEWDTATAPYCQKIQCPALYPVGDQIGVVNISCSNENYYGSNCTYTCIDGYDMLPGYNPIKLCTDNETWVGDTPLCYDTSAPVYTDCPFVVTGYAEQLQESGHVFWDKPIATDNSGSPVPVFQTSGPVSGSDLQVGKYDVEYSSTDVMNNTATCSFTVIVKQISCPELEEVPYMTAVCPNGRILGASCDFYCEEGTILNGQASAVCGLENTSIPVGQWNFQQQPNCEAIDTCPTINNPMNGVLDCDTWELGTVCHMTCEEGFVVTNDTSTDFDEVAVYDTLIVCGQSGYWTNDGELPNCQEEDARTMLYLTAGIEYGNIDDCTALNNETLHGDLLQTFKLALQPVCQSPFCNVTDIQDICADSVRRKRSDSAMFELSIHLPPNMTSVNIASLRSDIIYITKSSELYENLTIDVGVENNTPENIEVSQPYVVCEAGSGYDTKTSKCVKCNAGYYMDNMTSLCIACPMGYYQDTPRQTSCIQCPEGSTTETRAASALSLCIEGCAAGYYSESGTPPCSACEMGSYSDTSSSTQCTQCPASQTTFTPASTSVSDCQDFDVLFTAPDTNSTPVYVTTELQNISTFTLSFWLQCYMCDEIITLSESHEAPIMSIGNTNSLVLQLKSGQYVSNVDISDSTVWRKLTVSHTKQDMRIYLGDTVVLHVPTNRSITENVTSPVTLAVGGDGFQGSVSQLHMLSYLLLPDSNHTGTCVADVSGDLVQWKQFTQHEGSFVITFSSCDATNNCSSSPCQNGGSCAYFMNGFTCACLSGYTGTICETEIDDCEGHICQNNGTCTDGLQSYTCTCADGYTGDLCELLVVHGGWTNWDITGSCSVSCGTGVQQRARVCDNPLPINGGTECQGNSDDVIACETGTVCVNECSINPTSVDYGDMNCDWTDNKTRACAPACHDGYDFDNDIYLNPVCGTETGYTWSINNGYNPYDLIPSCTAKNKALLNTMHYSAEYLLSSLDATTRTSIIDVVNGKLHETGCISTGRCTLVETIVSLVIQSSRKKRDTGSSVMFTSTVTCEPTTGTDDCYNLLVDFLNSMELYIEQRELTVQYDGVDYDVEVNSSSVDGTSQCSHGYIPVMHYCLHCGKGAYAVNNYCELCALGYYQDEVGQTTCKQCPDGYTTEGLMTRDRELCNVMVPASDEKINWQLFTVVTLASLVGVILIVAGVYLVWDRQFKREKKKKIVYCDTPEPETPPVVRFNMKNIWYMGKPVKKDQNWSPDDEVASVDNDSVLTFDVVEDITWNNDDFQSIELPETPLSYSVRPPTFRYSSPIPVKPYAWK
ncbi:sushi, von Willebrand factor type A, EGF and pentraxin domain-containing protein 1-like [Mercenaria mercenaria]|uniref:sushi, von Willebrand factor type A, EGF and pentraxin domain-containing protein 1-like n=1 Tax=Mercenaria mercenaria TaxID=6596 RepID=UPI00234F03F5|nr:sushi, von Willebrand factor type A, EGF and pentraxin domain-containing protein 1-like [Mercenaria mercenaria]